MRDVKEPKHCSKRVGREVPGVVAVLCVVNTGPMLIAVSITEMVILHKYVKIIIIIIQSRVLHWADGQLKTRRKCRKHEPQANVFFRFLECSQMS